MHVSTPYDIEKSARIRKTARLTGLTTRGVRYVIDGERENETVMQVYMELLESEKRTESALMQEVNKLVPFN